MRSYKFLKKLWSHPVVMRYTQWEYLPIPIANFPVFLIVLYFATRARKLTFFSAANPAIDTGGVFGESKISILRQFDVALIPETIFVPKDTAFEVVCAQIVQQGLQFPLIAKPNIGERGQWVSKVENWEALKNYAQKLKADFILQTFVNFPKEVSILYYRYPNEQKGKIASLCVKEFLSVTGNGSDTVAQLMSEYPRANIQLRRFQKQKPELMDYIPAIGEKIELEPIGNHSRGTTFLNGNELITEQLTQVFDTISLQLEGIYYGRYDIKCESVALMEKGEGFKILEFNGVAGEPAHVYDPSYPIWKKYRDIYQCWKVIYEISQIKRKQGIEAMNLQEAWSKYGHYRKYMKTINALHAE